MRFKEIFDLPFAVFMFFSATAVWSPKAVSQEQEQSGGAFLTGEDQQEEKEGEASGKPPFTTPKAEPEEKVRDAVQVTELGLMRTLVVFNEGVDESLVKLANQHLSGVHFRVFEACERAPAEGASSEVLKRMGEEAKADLVLFASVESREKKAFGNARLYEGEASVEVVSPVSGELLVTHTGRAEGVRKFDPVEASRSATESVLDAVIKEAVVKTLEKSNKIIVYRVDIPKVPNQMELLRIKDQIARLQGVYHVREIAFDEKTNLATVEVIGSPKMLTFLKAHIETIPKTADN